MEKGIVEDLREILNSHGLSQDDFEIAEKDLTNWTVLPSTPIKSEITVHRKSTGRSKAYYSVHSSKWIYEFDTDLKNGDFN